jgi:hypothetical protein
MALWDRVTGEAVVLVPRSAPPGRHIADDAGDVAFGGIRAEPGDRLLAGPDHSWSAILPAGRVAGRFSPVEVIEAVEQSALTQILEELEAPDGALTWKRLRAVIPFKRPRPDQLEPTSTDRAIAVHGPHLLEVVRAPHRHLDAIIEPVRPALARRIPPRAIAHLAEHSEDWQRRTVRAVIPRRVLSQHADEQLDVYENRLVARTIDRLLSYLHRRAAALMTYQEQLDAGDQDDLGGPHWLAGRLAALWGTTFDVHEQRTHLETLQAQLTERRRRIGALQDSELYRAVPRRAAVGSRLRMTNVLSSQQHYRRVVALWRELDNRPPTTSAHDAYRAAQRALRAFDALVLVLIAHSLDGLGYAPPSGEASLRLTAPGELELAGPHGPLVLAWDPLRGATLHRGDVPLVRLVPLAARLASTLTDASPRELASIQSRVQDLRAEAKAAQLARHTVLIYPGRRRERERLEPKSAQLAQLLNPPDTGLASTPSGAVLPVSPLDLYSAERVDRVVRRAVLIDLFERFPPRVPCPRVACEQAAVLVPWLVEDPAGDALALLAPPDASQRAQLRARVQERMRTLRQRQDEALRDALSALPDAVERAAGSFEQLRRCPTCGAQGALQPWAQGHFKLACEACGTSWGMRPCVNCGARIPFLALDAKQRPNRRPVALSERLDREYGRDMLAIPRADVEDAFHCPVCDEQAALAT